MKFDVNVNVYLCDGKTAAEILSRLKALERQGEKMSVAVDNLKASVAKITSAADSAVALIKGLAAQIADLKDDPEALQAMSDELNAKADAIAEDVVANTPAE